ncbi:hypothetical protein [Tardiphaga alba]|uniref:hypothetical protein n=1 Tax=Tardiphaga alba TaxID=340268 RepID=UPI002E213A2F
MAIVPPASIATQLQMSADQIMLGGRAIQNVGVDLHGSAKSWAVERLEFQAPGATRVVASGASQSNVANSFSGAINVDSSDPDVLVGWLKGRSDTRLRDQKPLRIRGHFASTNDHLSVDKLIAEIDGGVLEGVSRWPIHLRQAARGSMRT